MARLAEFMGAQVETRAIGAHVWDDRGEKYLECGGYGVFILGHCHPRIVSAVIEQIRSHPLSSRLLLNPMMAKAAETLARVAPDGLDYVYFGLSGSEAVETALKLARMHDRRRIIAMENSYHGNSMGALSVTGRAVYREPFHPLLSDVEFVPFGDAQALEEALQRGPAACVLLEPVQGEGGVVIPRDGYLRQVERACREHDAFFFFFVVVVVVLDEIQTGLGRLGA
jgi:putrescine aminotransferase